MSAYLHGYITLEGDTCHFRLSGNHAANGFVPPPMTIWMEMTACCRYVQNLTTMGLKKVLSAAVLLVASMCVVHAGYPALFPYGYGAAPALVVPKVVAPVYTPVVAKVPTAVSYSYFHAVHPPPLIKLHAAPALVKLPYAHLYH
ncbi:hypothetical protein HPB50_010590 [Hyalomma asiaticum]|uniref:Uncharacterized protein n=1 Tax=Hyalomma asiaticum TaxID=266040 RepID=A0ACB7S0K2_HYAAI|nr:hypothetical protein HPB50_010590 [Hyalomma asiaticum]